MRTQMTHTPSHHGGSLVWQGAESVRIQLQWTHEGDGRLLDMTDRAFALVTTLALIFGAACASAPVAETPAPEMTLEKLGALVGPTWVATEESETPGGARYRSAKVFSSVMEGAGVEVNNFYVYADGARVNTLRGLYFVEPSTGEVCHTAVFSDGGLVREACYGPDGAGGARLEFEYVARSGQVFNWRASETVTPEGFLREHAEMQVDGEWQDMGYTFYAAEAAP